MREQVKRERAARKLRERHKISETRIPQNRHGVPLTPETIERYLEALQTKGRVQGTIDNYRRRLIRLYQNLPEDDKVIHRETLRLWQEQLVEDDCSALAVNQFMIAANGYLNYMGAREFQMTDMLDTGSSPQPELTRNEYLRLLSTARALGREQVYLMVKVFGNSDLPVQELQNLTVEAVRVGRLSIGDSGAREIIRLPGSVCRELLDYAKSRGIQSGPIFLTRNGKLIDRSNVTAAIHRLCASAQVPEEKGNPRCLRKLYQTTREGIERNIALLVEQAQDRLLEEEQLAVGWDR